MPALAERNRYHPGFAADLSVYEPVSTGLVDAEGSRFPQLTAGVPLIVTMQYGSGTGLTPSVQRHLLVIKTAAAALDEVVSPSEMLSLVRNTVGLNVKQAAAVFNVERPTIYLWADQHAFDRVRPQNRARMKQLYRLAQEFQAQGRLPNNALEAVLENSPSLFDLLCAPALDAAAILACYRKLLAMKGKLKEQQRANALAMGQAIAKGLASIGKARGE